MIVEEYTVVCDGCGARGPSSHASRQAAWIRAKAEGWTATPGNVVQHWCPGCTASRDEAGR